MDQPASTAFADGGIIPAHHTCDGAGLSPPIDWSDLPESTATVALIITDPDAHDFIHWLASDIPPGSRAGGLPEGASGSAAAGVEGRNDFGTVGYGPPCPPSGEHRYVVDVFALSDRLGLERGYSEAELRTRMQRVLLDQGSFTGRYQRGR